MNREYIPIAERLRRKEFEAAGSVGARVAELEMWRGRISFLSGGAIVTIPLGAIFLLVSMFVIPELTLLAAVLWWIAYVGMFTALIVGAKVQSSLARRRLAIARAAVDAASR